MDLDSPKLLFSAQRWMQAGLEKYVNSEDMDFAVHHFGVAIEHLLKAHLASLHPALVVDGKDFASLLHAIGQGASASQPMSGVKTITGGEAFDRCRHLLKTGLPDRIEYQPLLNARNGVSHIGYHDHTRARVCLIIAIRVADPLLRALGASEQAFWGSFDGLRTQLLSAQADELRVEYEAKIAGANAHLARLGSDIYFYARAAAEFDNFWGNDDSVPADCPVCGYRGRLSGSLGLGEAEGEDEDGAPTATTVVMLYAHGFDCRVCSLSLTLRELPLAGLPYDVATSFDPRDLHYPDEDLSRDR